MAKNDLSKKSIKNLGKMNSDYYQIVVPQLQKMDFKETLLFLETASVLGIKKRAVCLSIFERGV